MPMTSHLWAMAPEQAPAVFAELARNFSAEEAASPAAALQSRSAQNSGLYTVAKGVAVIQISGAITRNAYYSAYQERYITAGQDAIAKALDAAMSDYSVKAILLSFDSPGGTVAGVKELADKIAEAAKAKPMAAYADGLMASAAFWLGSATGTIFAPVTALVGSVGVIMSHADWSKFYERFGVAITYITGGKLKDAGYPSPLSDAARAYFQNQVEQFHGIFKTDVSRALGITAPESAWAEGQTLLAGEAKDAGLVTHIVRDLESAITQLSQEATMDYATLAAKHPELLAEITDKVKAESVKNHETALKAASQTATDSVLAMTKVVAGEDVHDKVAKLVAADVKPETLAAVTAILGKPVEATLEQTAESAEDKAKAAILAGIGKVTPSAVTGHAPGNPAAKSPLLADAERRAAAAKA